MEGLTEGVEVKGFVVGEAVEGNCVGFVDGTEVGKVELGIRLGCVVGAQTLGTKIVENVFRISQQKCHLFFFSFIKKDFFHNIIITFLQTFDTKFVRRRKIKSGKYMFQKNSSS